MWSYSKNVVATLIRKRKACILQREDSEEYFAKLSEFVGLARVAKWGEEEQLMPSQRDESPEVMDRLDVSEEKG